jgi:transcriptional regulator with XRE-family HTH domain
MPRTKNSAFDEDPKFAALFGQKVKLLLKARGMTQTSLGMEIGIAQQQISEWVRDSQPPHKPATLLRMARSLGTTADFLLDDEQKLPPGPKTEQEREVLHQLKLLGYRLTMARLTGSRDFSDDLCTPDVIIGHHVAPGGSDRDDGSVKRHHSPPQKR